MKENLEIAEQIGYPVIIKAAGGGGGRGMSIVRKKEDLINAISLTKSEARIAFNNDMVYMEKFLETHVILKFKFSETDKVMLFTYLREIVQLKEDTKRLSKKLLQSA